LIGGAHLAEGPHLRIVPSYAAGDARWGLEPLVNMIDHAARAVRKQFPDSVLSVGHLSRAGGGEIDRHASHESGRDADIGFYVKNQQGKSIYAEHFVAFRGDGTAPTWPGAQFDDARNWAFVAAVAGYAHAHVTHIFVASPLRARLLQYAEKIGAPPALRSRAAELMAQPKGALPHDDHFHLRIGCPLGMDKCIEQPVARKHPHGALAQAHRPRSGHAGAAQREARASTPPHAPSHGPAAPPRIAAAPPPPKANDRKDKTDHAERSDDAEQSKSDSLVPSLAPIVPGLDSVVIPAPLAGARPDKAEDKPMPPEPAPIDDPDGVLESR
jgi:penicillin-insensitive murein endopeptidase